MRLQNGLIIFLMGYSSLAGSFLLNSNIYVKVSNVFPNDIGMCALSTKKPVTQISQLQCLSYCNTLPRCYLTCNNGEFCTFYSAVVSSYWMVPDSQFQPHPLQTLNNSICYSSWYFEGDLTKYIVSIKASSYYSTFHLPNNTINGYFCQNDYYNGFLSNPGLDQWLLVTFDRVHAVSKVIIKLSSYTSRSLFQAVEVKVGNTTDSAGNFPLNLRLGSYPNVAPVGEVIIFESPVPIRGQFVSVQQLINDYFLIGDIKIIGV